MSNRIHNMTKVYRSLDLHGASTGDEIEAYTGLAHQVVSARLCDLKRRGVIRATGRTRKTRLGRQAQVLEVVR